MKKIFVSIWTLILLATVVCCSSRNEGGRFNLSPEQQRLSRLDLIDTTTLQSTLHLDSLEEAAQLSTLSADAWLLVDDSTGYVISQKNADSQRPIASLTKMMTCLLALENGNLTDTIEITEDVFVARDSRVRLGDRYQMENLIYEMMMLSDNDAAYALAKHVGATPCASVR